MSARIFVTGGSGFVGTAVIQTLLDRGHAVNALVHRGELKIKHERLTPFTGDIFSSVDLSKAMTGCDAVIHLVGIIREAPQRGVTFERMHVEATRQVVDATFAAGIRRYIHMSALGARPNAPSRYHQTKGMAEDHVRGSALEWTIFRPSLIHGPGGEFIEMEAAWARGKSMPFVAMPYFGSGILGIGPAAKIQPVAVAEVARAFVEAFDKPQSIGQTYDLGGSQQITWPQMHRIAAEIITGKRRAVLPIPSWYALLLTHVLPSRLLPFNRDQVLMAREDNTADMTRFTRDFGWQPGAFAQTLQTYAHHL